MASEIDLDGAFERLSQTALGWKAKAERLQEAIDRFLAPIYADAGRMVSEGGNTPLVEALKYTSVTCADLQALYDDTYPEELVSPQADALEGK